jgi:hypothetical protein
MEMILFRNRLPIARQYLEVFRESWKSDHDSAMECRDIEGLLGESVRMFDLIFNILLGRRMFVYRGTMEPSAEMDQEEKRLMGEFLDLMKSDLQQVDSLERTYGEVANAQAFRERVAQAEAFLAEWTPALPATAPGSRVIDFSEEDVAQMETLLKSPSGSRGRPTRAIRSLHEADPTLLK